MSPKRKPPVKGLANAVLAPVEVQTIPRPRAAPLSPDRRS